MRHHTSHTLLAAAIAATALVACRDATPTAPAPHAAELAATATGPAVSPVIIPAVSSCTELPNASAAWKQLRIDPAVSGTYTNGDVTVTLTMRDRYFDWSVTSTKSVGVDAVFAKSGSVGNLYRYDPPAERTSDAGLSGPLNKNRKPAVPTITNAVLFCYDLEASVSGTTFIDADASGTARDTTVVLPGYGKENRFVSGLAVYVDYDGDGVRDADEPAAAGGNGGAFTIAGVKPGTWTVRYDPGGADGWTCSYPSPCEYRLTLAGGVTYAGRDFGFWDAAKAIGYVVNQATGGRLQGWTVYADYDDDGALDSGEPSAVSDATGFFAVYPIRPGTWKIREVPQSAWTCTAPSPCVFERLFYSGGGTELLSFVDWTASQD